MIDVSKPWSDTELLALPPVVVDPGTTDANGIIRNRDEESPFKEAVLTRVPGARELSIRWAKLHGWIKDEYAAPDFSLDPFAAIRDAIGGQKLWHEARNEAGELMAVHPITAKDEAAWEEANRLMHENQRTILPEPKPENFEDYARRKHLKRGD